jgi:hypothetical protein
LTVSAGFAACFFAWTFLAFAGVDAAAAGAGAATGVTEVVAGVATFGAAGACAKETAATPVNNVAAIRDLIFNMDNSLIKRKSQ